MAVSKVSLSIEEDVLAEARERAGRRELSAYVNDALFRQLQHDRLSELLAEMETESGPIPSRRSALLPQHTRRPLDLLEVCWALRTRAPHSMLSS